MENKKIKLKQMKEQLKKLDKQLSNLETERDSLEIDIKNLEIKIKNYDTKNFRKEVMDWLVGADRIESLTGGLSTHREFYIIAKPKERVYGSLKDNPDGTKEELYALMEKYGMKEVLVESGDCDWGLYSTYISFKRK